MPTKYSNRWGRISGGHNIKIQGRAINIYFARLTYLCIHCLAPLKLKGAGLACTENPNHYGFISQKEADSLTQEERFMKIGEMFPSEYLRGVDISEPRKMKIARVTAEKTRNRDNNKMEDEFIIQFEGEQRKLRLNWTMAKAVHFEILNLNPDDEVDKCWPGNFVTVYRTTVKAFGKEHIVPRIRKPERGDQFWPPQNGKEKPLHKLNRTEFWGRVKRDLDLPVEVSKFILIQEGLDIEYKPENAQTIWNVLEETGRHLNGFLDVVLEDVPYFTEKSAILDVLTEWKAVYQFEEQFEMDMVAALETYARSRADSDLEQVDQLGFDAPHSN